MFCSMSASTACLCSFVVEGSGPVVGGGGFLILFLWSCVCSMEMDESLWLSASSVSAI